MRLVVTRGDYFEAAMSVLGEEGYGALKISPLCKRLGVTTGSFYNYFGSLDGFIHELLLFWEQDQTERLVSLALVPKDPHSQVSRLKKLALHEVKHASEFAIRAWSNVNAEVAQAQARVDEQRKAAMRRIYSELIPSKREVELLVAMGLSLLVGHQALRPHDNRELGRVFDEYHAVVFQHAEAAAVRRVRSQAG